MNGSTHQSGHTLDLVITRTGVSLVSDVSIMNPGISDHEAIMSNLAAEKPKPVSRERQYRSLKKVDFTKFGNDYIVSELSSALTDDINELTALYNGELSCILDIHDPLKKKAVPVECSSWIYRRLVIPSTTIL